MAVFLATRRTGNDLISLKGGLVKVASAASPSRPVQGLQAAPIRIGGTLQSIQSPGADKKHHFWVIFKMLWLLDTPLMVVH